MIEANGDLWTYFNEFKTLRVVPTNGYVKYNNELVMGKGVALQARKKYIWLPRIFGEKVKEEGNIVFIIEDYDIASFPTKHLPFDDSSTDLIERSAIRLAELTINNKWDYVVLPRVGCGEGRLDWDKTVKPILSKYLTSSMYIVVNKESEKTQ